MPCYHPISGWLAQTRNASGKRSIVFRLGDGFKDRPASVPCGRCVGCRLEKARQWALRCVHEASLHESNWFGTFTYENAPVTEAGLPTLRPKDFQDFMKRLRHRSPGVRFLQCGEYGEKLGRPHHHAILFNLVLPDVRRHSGTGSRTLYTSEVLRDCWSHGHISLGMVSFESAGYVARYTLKKQYGPASVLEDHYRGRVPEFQTMSRRPGIGAGWIEENADEVYRLDAVTVANRSSKPPRFYDDRFGRRCPRTLEAVKEERARQARERAAKDGPSLADMEAVKLAAIDGLRREMELYG